MSAQLIINIELNGTERIKFEEVKAKIGVTKPNTEILRVCIAEVHTRLFPIK